MELRQARASSWRFTWPVQHLTVRRELPLSHAVLRPSRQYPASLEVTVAASDRTIALRLASVYRDEALALLVYFLHVVRIPPSRGPLMICPVVLARMEARGFRRARQLLAIDAARRTEMEARLLQALKWVGDGLAEPKSTEAFLHFVIALEVLLGSTGRKPGIIQALGHKAAVLIRELQPEVDRVRLYHRVRALYKERCNVVHQGRAVADAAALVEIESIVLRLLDGFLTQGWLARFPRWSLLHHWAGQQHL